MHLLDPKNNPIKDDEPGQGLTLILPVLAMGALIGILALLMRSTGKW
jgi:LPS O-antigen subunit length determinant protein (WzzB/FepE family)